MNAFRTSFGRGFIGVVGRQTSARIGREQFGREPTSSVLFSSNRPSPTQLNFPSSHSFAKPTSFVTERNENSHSNVFFCALAAAAAAFGGTAQIPSHPPTECMPPKRKQQLKKRAPPKNNILQKAGGKGGRGRKEGLKLNLQDPSDSALDLVCGIMFENCVKFVQT